ncbi:MAG: DUF6524 family protein [Pseudomonadota bacterium]
MAFASSTAFGFGIRVAASILVVLLTYNPTGFLSYVHWVQAGFDTDVALKVLAGLLLLISYVVLLRATFYSIGVIGIGLVVAVLAAFVWVMIDLGVLSLDDPGVLQWLALIGVGVVMGIGLSWALIRKRLSGQYTVDDPDSGA